MKKPIKPEMLKNIQCLEVASTGSKSPLEKKVNILIKMKPVINLIKFTVKDPTFFPDNSKKNS